MDQIKKTCPKCKKLFSANEELKKILREKEQKYLEELKVKGYPIVLVLRSDGGCMDWWRKCGAFNITYPNYQYYKTRTIMWSHIKNQNRDIKLFYQNNQENITEVKNNEELCKSLEIAYPKDTPLHDYKEKNVRVFVYK